MAKTDAETPANPYADWPTKQQVAEETGISVRTLERMIQQKQLQVRVATRLLQKYTLRDVKGGVSERGRGQ